MPLRELMRSISPSTAPPMRSSTLAKLVQRLFLLPGTSKVVVFSGVERGSG